MGKLVFERTCAECHYEVAPPLSLTDVADVVDAVWAANMEEHADYYFWFESEAPSDCHQGPPMRLWKELLPPKQRWEVLNYIRSAGTLGCNRGIYPYSY